MSKLNKDFTHALGMVSACGSTHDKYIDFNQLGGMLRCLNLITGKMDVVKEEVMMV